MILYAFKELFEAEIINDIIRMLQNSILSSLNIIAKKGRVQKLSL